MDRRCILIPAVKKNVAFDNDLVKRLGGKLLIQHAIDKALRLERKARVWVVTDSQEIELICQRAGVNCLRDSSLRLGDDELGSMAELVDAMVCQCDNFLLLWPYAPLLGVDRLEDAWGEFRRSRAESLLSVAPLRPDLFLSEKGLQPAGASFPLYRKMRAFHCFTRAYLRDRTLPTKPFVVDDLHAEIASFRDWWVCEKLLERRRILFRVIGSNQLGMGHIYRALTLAHEVTDHEILFLCNREHDVAVNKIAGFEYFLKTCEPGGEIEAILELNPDLVVNDCLDTSAEDMRRLRRAGIRTVNFEDLGTGAAEADLAVNELYDAPQFEGGNVLWGHSWAFLREEFHDAKQHAFRNKVDSILLTFGGADPSDMTMSVLAMIQDYCIARGIAIHVVCGTAYIHKDRLREHVERTGYPRLHATFETGVISRIMERTSVAISSNGRTAYELAHMRIPSIIVAHNEREHTHRFTVEENGFLNLGMFSQLQEGKLSSELDRLLTDTSLRRRLHDNMRRFDFVGNKSRVLDRMVALLDRVED